MSSEQKKALKDICHFLLKVDTLYKHMLSEEENVCAVNDISEKIEKYISFRNEQMKYLKEGSVERAKEYEEEANSIFMKIMLEYYKVV